MLLFIFLVAMFCWLWKQRKNRMSILERHGIPGPKPHFLWGNLNEYLSMPNVVWDSELINRYGPTCGYYFGAKPVILTCDPELAELVLSKHGNNFLHRPRRVPGGINPEPKRAKMLGNLEVPEWKSLRGVLDKGFSPANLKAMSGDIRALVEILLEKVEEGRKGHPAPINFYELYQNFTLDLIGKTGFGLNSDIQRNPNDALKSAVEEEFSKNTGSLTLKVFLCFPEIHWILQPLRILLEKVKVRLGFGGSSALWDLGFKTVNDRSLKRAHCGDEDEEARSDLLQTMLKSGKLSEVSVVANSVLFFEAGFETLSAGLAFTTYLLSRNSEVQVKVRNEIEEILQATGGELFAIEELKKFKYLDAVIKESLRMYPPQTTFIGRSGSVDLPFISNEKTGQGTCFKIPQQVHVQVGLYQMMNSEAIWGDSVKCFRPERFLEEQTHEQGLSFLAFGKGKRICIGRKYAEIVMKMTLITLLSRYKLNPASDDLENKGKLEVVFKTATMTPKDGVYGTLVFDPLFD